MITCSRRPRPSPRSHRPGSGPSGRLAGSGSSAARRFAALLVLGLVPILAGCSTQSRSWPGVPAEQVWTAMKSAAAAPDYDGIDPDTRWNVDENRVRVIEEEGRIEVFRELDRRRVPPGGAPVTERRTWRFGIAFDPEPDAPTVTFRSRGVAVPMHVHEEAQRYFAQIDAILAPYAGLID